MKVKKENLVKASKQIVFIGEGFSLKLGFRKYLCSEEMDLVLFQVSHKFCVHQRTLYKLMQKLQILQPFYDRPLPNFKINP